MQTDDGNSFAILERNVNLAGFPYDETKGNSVIASLFKSDGNEQNQTSKRSETVQDLKDDIPF